MCIISSKRSQIKSFLIVFAIFFSVLNYAQAIDVMTFNIRLDNAGDKENSWTDGNRKERVVKFLKAEKPAILGVQEALHHQVEFLENAFPNYQRVGVGRDDGKQGGEHMAVFFDKKRFKLLDSGQFWLSQTPEIPSKGWDGTCCNRITTWLKLQQGDKVFFVFNTHFDHEGKVAQRESAYLILSKIKEITADLKANVILMGDFNVPPQHEGIVAIKKQLKDTYKSYKNIPKGTFTAFKLDEEPKQRIDFIFISDGLRAKNYKIIDKKIDGLYPSDHFPVKVTIELPNRKD
ncbi:endonuclease/exonuclease/phosphatase family protein [Capnocytophaga stomatis]|uniref:endonuclease/exonuclease/phosphatase family protein n=1 Tax=Capnocytophaga stomatis TaxID=1848904 RepID=UPI00385C8617